MGRVINQGIFDWDQTVRGFLISRRADGRSPETIRFYAQNLDRFRRWVAERFPDVKGPLDVRADVVREFLTWLLTEPVRWGGSSPTARRPVTPHGAHRYYRTLRAFYRWVAAEVGQYMEGWVNPMDGIRGPRLPQNPIPSLGPEELRRLLDACAVGRTAERDRVILLVLVDKGLRARELLGLTLDDWDWATGTLTVRRSKGGRIRQVVLHPAANAELKKYVFRHRPDVAVREIFLTEEGQPLTYSGLRMLFRRLQERTGIRVHPHLLRHTFALWWVTAGGSLHELQALLGHSSPAMSLQYGRMVSDRVDPDRQAAFSPVAAVRRGRESGRGSRPRPG